MWVEAVLSKEDLTQVVGDFLPTTIRLGEDGELHLEDPSDVKLVENDGLYIRCSGRVKWSLLGFTVPVTIKQLAVCISPFIEKRPNGDHLRFKVRIDDLDLALVPGILDTQIVSKVNAEIGKTPLAWNFTQTLSHTFQLPKALNAPRSLGLQVQWGEAKVTAEALVLVVSFKAEVGRLGNSASAGEALSPPPDSEPPTARVPNEAS